MMMMMQRTELGRGRGRGCAPRLVAEGFPQRVTRRPWSALQPSNLAQIRQEQSGDMCIEYRAPSRALKIARRWRKRSDAVRSPGRVAASHPKRASSLLCRHGEQSWPEAKETGHIGEGRQHEFTRPAIS